MINMTKIYKEYCLICKKEHSITTKFGDKNYAVKEFALRELKDSIRRCHLLGNYLIKEKL